MTNFSLSRFSRRSALAGAGSAALVLAAPGRSLAQTAAFRIGGIASLTGPAAAFSKDWAEGFQAYVKDWNARGGLKGAKIEFELLDDETVPVNAVNVYRRLATAPDIRVIWIALASQTALGIKAISGEFKVPTVSGGGVDELGRPAAPWFFKVAPGGSDYVKAVVEFAKRKGFKTIAGLHATDAIGQADQRWLREFAAAAGLTVAIQESFATADTNFNAQLVKIRNARPDVFYNGATGGPAILVFKQIKQLGVAIPMFLSQAAVSRAFFEGIGGAAEAEGVYSVISIGALAADVGGETSRIFADLSRALGRTAILFHTFGWDTGIVTEWAAVNSDGSRQGIRDAMERVRELPAINGPFNFRPDDHIGQDTRGLVVARLSGGKFVKAE